MTLTRPAPRRTRSRPLATLLAVLVAVGASPLPPSAAVAEPLAAPGIDVRPLSGPPEGAGASDDPTGLRPSIAYEQAMAFAGQDFSFEPGGRVDVPFRPRAGDASRVDGAAPRALPAGRASGLEIARAARGGAQPGTGSPAPSSDPGSADPSSQPAAASSAQPSTEPAADAAASPSAGPVDAPVTGDAIPATGSAFADPDVAAVAAPAAGSGLRKEVFGFLPYWELSSGSTLNYNVLSTVAYFGLGVTSTGGFVTSGSNWSGWTSSQLTSIINAAHGKGTRVVLTVQSFAWTTSQANTQKALLGSATARQTLAANIARAVRDRGIGGVNLDFEPLVSGYESQFVDLLKRVRTEFNKVAPGYQITYDTTGYIGNYPLEATVAPGAADAIFIMGYDYRTSSSGYVGSIDPLAGPAYDLTDTVRAYSARVHPSKLILGVPWYGRAWSTVSDSVNAKNQSGTKFGTSTAVNYENVVPLVAQHGRKWDTRESSPWIAYRRENCTTTYGCVTSWRQVYYDDPQSLKLRYDLVNNYGLRGAGIWALGYDGGRTDMYAALAEKFLNDTVAPAAGVTALAATQRDEGFEVSWSAVDISPITSYDVQVSVDGGAWTGWLDTGTAATSEIYPGTDGHGYAFRVRARDAKGNLSAWNVTSVYAATPTIRVGGFGRTRVDSLSYRSGPTTGAARLGTLPLGTVVAITGGPVSADGYTWWEVTQPVREWGPVSFAERGVWVAGGSSTEAYLAAVQAPNATKVSAALRGFTFNGSGLSSIGAAAAGSRVFSPNGDGIADSIAIDWTSTITFTSLEVRIWRADGTLAGTRALTALTPGARRFTWDGKVNGVTVPEGTYALQIVGSAGGATYAAPSAQPTSAAQLAAYGVTVIRTTVSRHWGQTKYDTAAAISAATFSPGAPVVYVATGENFPDALVGAAAAGKAGAPLLLTPRTSIPASIRAELTRLAPGRIVVLGGTGVISDATMAALGAYASGNVSRHWGQTKYDTAAAISAATFSPGAPVVYVATGENFPDALVGAAAAGKAGAPLLLTPRTSIPASIRAELTRLAPGRIVVLGGTGVISDATMAALGAYASGNVTRHWGQTKYDTAAAISAATFSPGAPVVYVATGENFPDALVGAAAAGKAGAPLLLTPRTSIPASIRAELTRLAPGRIVVLGGTGVISDATMAELRDVAAARQ